MPRKYLDNKRRYKKSILSKRKIGSRKCIAAIFRKRDSRKKKIGSERCVFDIFLRDARKKKQQLLEMKQDLLPILYEIQILLIDLSELRKNYLYFQIIYSTRSSIVHQQQFQRIQSQLSTILKEKENTLNQLYREAIYQIKKFI